MTNASIKNIVSVLAVVALSVAFSVGAFATTVHAQEDMGFGDIGGDNIGYGDIGGDNLGYGDIGGNNIGYGDIGGDNIGYGDIGGDNLGYGDIGGDNLGYGDIYGNCGCDTASFQNGYTSMTPSFSSIPSFGSIPSYRPVSFSFPSTPISFNAPSYIPPAPRINTPVASTPSNTTNVNNNTNNNVNNNNININNNSSAIAIATVAAAPVQYQAQYVQPTYVQPTYVRPYCTISINNYNGNNYGPYSSSQLATLTWSSQNATSGYISPSVGSVSGYGSMQVYPTNGQTYTMTVYGQGGSANCSTQPFYVQNYVAPITYQNPTPYVSLSQIPYTGFDFGTMGNAIYWLSLMVFAGAAAYLVLYFQGGALAVLGMKRSENSAIAMPKITVTRAPAPVAAVARVEEMVVSPIQIATNRTSTSDTMHVTHSKAGAAPRIHISRD